jgi:hypothetical protein
MPLTGKHGFETNAFMNEQTSAVLKNHYLSACYSAVLTAALCVIMYPAQHGIETVGRGVVIIAAFIGVALFAMVVSRAVKEKELDEGDVGGGESSAAGRYKKMGLLWYGFAVLLSTTMIRIPGIKWYKGLEALNRIDQVSLALGTVILLSILWRIYSLARISIQN